MYSDVTLEKDIKENEEPSDQVDRGSTIVIPDLH